MVIRNIKKWCLRICWYPWYLKAEKCTLCNWHYRNKQTQQVLKWFESWTKWLTNSCCSWKTFLTVILIFCPLTSVSLNTWLSLASQRYKTFNEPSHIESTALSSLRDFINTYIKTCLYNSLYDFIEQSILECVKNISARL